MTQWLVFVTLVILMTDIGDRVVSIRVRGFLNSFQNSRIFFLSTITLALENTYDVEDSRTWKSG